VISKEKITFDAYAGNDSFANRSVIRTDQLRYWPNGVRGICGNKCRWRTVTNATVEIFPRRDGPKMSITIDRNRNRPTHFRRYDEKSADTICICTYGPEPDATPPCNSAERTKLSAVRSRRNVTVSGCSSAPSVIRDARVGRIMPAPLPSGIWNTRLLAVLRPFISTDGEHNTRRSYGASSKYAAVTIAQFGFLYERLVYFPLVTRARLLRYSIAERMPRDEIIVRL